MVNVRELRIGNAIWDVARNKIKWVNHRVINDMSDGNFIPRSYDPIPLTPEILLKCGFEKIGGAYFLKMFSIQSDMTVYFEVDNGIGGGRAEYLCDRIKSLHQLQNLHFALYGEELPFNT